MVQEGDLKSHLEQIFGGPFFFNAPAFAEAKAQVIELSTVFRQRDDRFLAALNAIREGDPLEPATSSCSTAACGRCAIFPAARTTSS